MKRALAWILVLVFLVPGAWAADKGWPEELADVHALVKAKFGDVPFDRVKVRRDGKATEVSIKLKNIPRQFRTFARERAGDDELFLVTNFVELFEPDFDIFGFDVFPRADLVSYYYGFVALNFGKKIKRRAEITVFGNGVDIQKIKKKLKLRKKTAMIFCVEDKVSEPGLYALYTELGPYDLTNFFCSSCG